MGTFVIGHCICCGGVLRASELLQLCWEDFEFSATIRR